MNRRWTDPAIERAIAMHKGGKMNWHEIAHAFGETHSALYAAVERYRRRKAGISLFKDTRPIAFCPERNAYETNARIGSAQLRDEILRVFGPQRRMAA